MDDATNYQDQHEAHLAALLAAADVELQRTIAAPLEHLRALGFAAGIVHVLRERNEGIGTTPRYFVDLVRTHMSVDRRRLGVPEMSLEEEDILDEASEITHRLALKDARVRGLPIKRPARVRGSVIGACVSIERASPGMGVVQ